MAKKKTKKKANTLGTDTSSSEEVRIEAPMAKPEVCNSETEVARVDEDIAKINERIDRIVAALSKAKSVKGM